MRRWLFYHILAWHDIFRLWSTTQHQVVIVAGICLPILLLLGLKQGHVAELREDLLTSPSGRQIVLWSAQGGKLLDEEVIDNLAAQVPGTDLVIPETQRTVTIRSAAAGQDDPGSDDDHGLVTLYSTVQGDPVLSQYQADVVSGEEPAVILTEVVATRAGVKVGESLPVELRRRRESVEESHTISVKVVALIPGGDSGSQIGYAHLDFLRNLEQYVRGHAVPQYDLPTIKGLSARDEYLRYLLFCQKGSQTELQPDDFRFFEERGLEWVEVENPDQKSLLGVLKLEQLDELKVFELRQRPNDGVAVPLRLSPLFISENTAAIDDFVLRWNPPLDASFGDQACLLIGLSLPTTTQTGGWIHDYLAREVGFDFEQSQATPFAVHAQSGSPLNGSVVVALRDGTEIELNGAAADATKEARGSETPAGVNDPQGDVPDEAGSSPPAANKSPIPERMADATSEPDVATSASPADPETSQANSGGGKETVIGTAEQRLTFIVPANLLAWMHGHLAGNCRYDARGRVFAPLGEVVIYDKARLYTKTIDDVPNAVKHLSESGYAVLSEGNRIAEIQSQDQSLQLLVVVVAVGVLFFGIITVVSVLVDATDRKRGTIGILRVMGMSQMGVFYVVVVRAVFIGVLAALLSLALGYSFAWILGSGPEELGWRLPWRPINVVFQEVDLAMVFIGALVCSGVGALIPAWRAGTIDPFDAIIEGRFK